MNSHPNSNKQTNKQKNQSIIFLFFFFQSIGFNKDSIVIHDPLTLVSGTISQHAAGSATTTDACSDDIDDVLGGVSKIGSVVISFSGGSISSSRPLLPFFARSLTISLLKFTASSSSTTSSSSLAALLRALMAAAAAETADDVADDVTEYDNGFVTGAAKFGELF